MSKKGALELSINAIVIIVLAMTLLGLGLFYIRKTLSDITDTSAQVSDQIRDQILEDLRRGDKRLSFPTPQIDIGWKDTEIISIGIKNMFDTTLRYKVKIMELSRDPDTGELLDCPQDSPGTYTPRTSSKGQCAGFYWDDTDQVLNAGESTVMGIKLFPPKSVSTYLYKLVIWDLDDDSEYTSKTFFVNVQ